MKDFCDYLLYIHGPIWQLLPIEITSLDIITDVWTSTHKFLYVSSQLSIVISFIYPNKEALCLVEPCKILGYEKMFKYILIFINISFFNFYRFFLFNYYKYTIFCFHSLIFILFIKFIHIEINFCYIYLYFLISIFWRLIEQPKICMQGNMVFLTIFCFIWLLCTVLSCIYVVVHKLSQNRCLNNTSQSNIIF